MRYIIDFYDGFDGWIYKGMEPPKDHTFDDLEKAQKFCDEKNEELSQSNKNFGEHWGVIDTEINQEINCCQHKLKKEIK